MRNLLPLLQMVLVVTILVWDVALTARIVQVRTLPRAFVAITAIAGFLLLPSLVIHLATTSSITGRAVTQVDWLWPFTLCLFGIQALYAAVRPMEASAWLEVAQLRYTIGQPAARSIEAFSLAQLTAPYEGNVMAGRAMLGPLLWDNLADEDKRRTVRDLALAPFAPPEYLRVQALLRAKPKPVREEIRNGVLAVDSRPEDRLDMLGLKDPDSRAR